MQLPVELLPRTTHGVDGHQRTTPQAAELGYASALAGFQ